MIKKYRNYFFRILPGKMDSSCSFLPEQVVMRSIGNNQIPKGMNLPNSFAQNQLEIHKHKCFIPFRNHYLATTIRFDALGDQKSGWIWECLKFCRSTFSKIYELRSSKTIQLSYGYTSFKSFPNSSLS